MHQVGAAIAAAEWQARHKRKESRGDRSAMVQTPRSYHATYAACHVGMHVSSLFTAGWIDREGVRVGRNLPHACSLSVFDTMTLWRFFMWCRCDVEMDGGWFTRAACHATVLGIGNMSNLPHDFINRNSR